MQKWTEGTWEVAHLFWGGLWLVLFTGITFYLGAL